MAVEKYKEMSKPELVAENERKDDAKRRGNQKKKTEGYRSTRLIASGVTGVIRGALRTSQPDLDYKIGPVSIVDLALAIGGTAVALGSKGSAGNVAEGVGSAGLTILGLSLGDMAGGMLP